jgi:hypothetical protein
MAGGGGIVHIPWYATLFRGDRFGKALELIAPIALRYGATDFEVRRSREDRYKFLQTATFRDPADFYAYWEGPEFLDFRTRYSSWFQVPVVYDWQDRLTHGELPRQAEDAVRDDDSARSGISGETTGSGL